MSGDQNFQDAYAHGKDIYAWCGSIVYNIPYEEAWIIIRNCFSYANHTVMSEALETWSLSIMQTVLPWYNS